MNNTEKKDLQDFKAHATKLKAEDQLKELEANKKHNEKLKEDNAAHDQKVAALIAAMTAAKATPTRTDLVPAKIVSASTTFTIDVNECIRLKEDGNYGILAPQHQQLNELFIEQANLNQANWSFDEGGHCLVAISWEDIHISLTDDAGNSFVDMEDRIWNDLSVKQRNRFSGGGPVGQPTQLPSTVFGTYKQSFKGQTEYSLNNTKAGKHQGKKIGAYTIVIGNGDLTK